MSSSTPILGHYDHNTANDEPFQLAFSATLSRISYQLMESLKMPAPLALLNSVLLDQYSAFYLSNAECIHIVGFPYGGGNIHILDAVKIYTQSLCLRSHRDVGAASAAGHNVRFIPDVMFSVLPQGGAMLDQLMPLSILWPQGLHLARKKIFVFLLNDCQVDCLLGNRNRFEQIKPTKERIAKAFDIALRINSKNTSFASIWGGSNKFFLSNKLLDQAREIALIFFHERPMAAADLLSALDTDRLRALGVKCIVYFRPSGSYFYINIEFNKKASNLMQNCDLFLSIFDPTKGASECLVVCQDAPMVFLRRHRSPESVNMQDASATRKAIR